MSWTEIGSIKSKTSRNRAYSLDTNEDGDLRCSCAAWIHSLAPKTCKHTESPEAGTLLRAHLARLKPAVSNRIPRSAYPSYSATYGGPTAHVRERVLVRLETVLFTARTLSAYYNDLKLAIDAYDREVARG